jgi:hypothetical protein
MAQGMKRNARILPNSSKKYEDLLTKRLKNRQALNMAGNRQQVTQSRSRGGHRDNGEDARPEASLGALPLNGPFS